MVPQGDCAFAEFVYYLQFLLCGEAVYFCYALHSPIWSVGSASPAPVLLVYARSNSIIVHGVVAALGS